ncbi:hypothetical protein ACL7TT_07345 [Microbulbifer sp. 2304DJ12-6]|uniref:hypothetical protein n=1 Tax=Microbulbifer sp. 2304DJ12-6 TaxID=3233340 RepID=UPI0039B032AC
MSTEIDITGRVAGKLTVPRKDHSHMATNGVAHSLHYDANGTIEPEDTATGDDKWIRWNARQLPREIVLGSSQNDSTLTARDRFKYAPDGSRRQGEWARGSGAATAGRSCGQSIPPLVRAISWRRGDGGTELIESEARAI